MNMLWIVNDHNKHKIPISHHHILTLYWNRRKMGRASTYNLSATQANGGHKNPAFDDGEIAGDMQQNGGLRQIKIDTNKSRQNDKLTPL